MKVALLGKTTTQQKKNHFFSLSLSLSLIHQGNINQKEQRDDHHFWHRPKHPLPDSYVNDRPSIYGTYSADYVREVVRETYAKVSQSLNQKRKTWGNKTTAKLPGHPDR